MATLTVCEGRISLSSERIRLNCGGFCREIPPSALSLALSCRPLLFAGVPVSSTDQPVCERYQLAIKNPSESCILFNPGCVSRIPAVALTLAGAKRAMRIVSAVAVFQHVATDSGFDPKRVNRAASHFRSARRPAVVVTRGTDNDGFPQAPAALPFRRRDPRVRARQE
jgi:hypothetical protein